MNVGLEAAVNVGVLLRVADRVALGVAVGVKVALDAGVPVGVALRVGEGVPVRVDVGEGVRVLEQGYLLGFTGVVTFKNSEALRELVKQTPRDRMLVETDAPYLSPEPMRKQKVNEPSFVVHTAQPFADRTRQRA